MNGMGLTSHLLQPLDLWGHQRDSPNLLMLIRERGFSKRARPPRGLSGGIFSPCKRSSVLTQGLCMQRPETRTTLVMRTGTIS